MSELKVKIFLITVYYFFQCKQVNEMAFEEYAFPDAIYVFFDAKHYNLVVW